MNYSTRVIPTNSPSTINILINNILHMRFVQNDNRPGDESVASRFEKSGLRVPDPIGPLARGENLNEGTVRSREGDQRFWYSN